MLTSPLPSSNRQARRGSLGDADNFRPCTVAPSLPKRNGSHKGLGGGSNPSRTLETLKITGSSTTTMSDFSAISDITEPSLYELDMSKTLNLGNSSNTPATSEERWASSHNNKPISASGQQPVDRPTPRRGRRRVTGSPKQNQSAEDLVQQSQQQQPQGLHQKQHRRRSLGDALNFAVDTSAPAQPARLDSSHRLTTTPSLETEEETSPKPKQATPPKKSRRASMTDAVASSSNSRFQPSSPLPKRTEKPSKHHHENHNNMIAALYGYEPRSDSPHNMILQQQQQQSKNHRSHRRASMSDMPPERPDSLHKRSTALDKTPSFRGVAPGSLLKAQPRRGDHVHPSSSAQPSADASPTRPDSLHRRTKKTEETTVTNTTAAPQGRKLRRKGAGRSRRASLSHVPTRTTTTR